MQIMPQRQFEACCHLSRFLLFIYGKIAIFHSMKILGIETSCDETAAAIVDSDKNILSNIVLTQLKDHSVFGGVVPEIAARAHLDHMDKVVEAAMKDAGCDFADLDAVAATCGPGLIGGVMIGMMTAKAIAATHQLPFIAVNHLEAHALTPRLTDDVPFPYLLLLASGGHTQLLIVEDVGQYTLLGGTLDDALGECFDKSAKAMGLPFPGGPHLEKIAQSCTDHDAALARFPLPTPMKGRKNCDFSFSGLKTAARTHVQNLPEGALKEDDIAALAYSFETAVCNVLTDRCSRAIDAYKQRYPQLETASFVVAGGVAANTAIRNTLMSLAENHKISFRVPPVSLCSDNGAMIAWAGIENYARGKEDPLNIAARPRWPLEELHKTTAAS